MLTTRFTLSFLAVSLLLLSSAQAQVPTIGLVGEGASCELPFDIPAAGGEVFAVKLTGGRPLGVQEADYLDWQVHMDAKGGACRGMQWFDVQRDALQVLGGNFTEAESPRDVVVVFSTFADGRVAVNSGALLVGFNWMGHAAQQVVGDSFPLLEGTAGVTLPGLRAGYAADLGSGPEVFPQSTGEGWRVAWAPLLEVHDEPGILADEGCRIAGEWGDIEVPDDVAFGEPATRLPWGIIAGYNVYRMLAEGDAPPAAAELGTVENWVYFAPLRPDVSVPDDLSELVDPDGVQQTGDEVLVFHDTSLNSDGSERQAGVPSSAGANYWYAFQPVVLGSVDDWANVRIAYRPPRDYRTDVDGDGLFDSIKIEREDGLADATGSTFFSPQAEWGLPGLGLTNGGLPLLSPVVHTAADNGDEDCVNGEDDDGDGLVDCDDGDCDAHDDCTDAGGGIRIGLPDGGPELIVGWDETMGLGAVTLSRGSLTRLWQERQLRHSPVGCELLGRELRLPTLPGSNYFLAAPGGSSPDYGNDSEGRLRAAADPPCP